jgi:hypothetical protein
VGGELEVLLEDEDEDEESDEGILWEVEAGRRGEIDMLALYTNQYLSGGGSGWIGE